MSIKFLLGIIRHAPHRERFINSLVLNDDSATIITENYYEIIKELGTIILLIDGFKTIGEYAHKEIIESLDKYANFNTEEISVLQDLRIRRNNSMYEGKQTEPSYLKNYKNFLLKIIDKLKNIIGNELK